MNFFKNLTISKKLLFGFSAIILVATITLGLSLRSLWQFKESVDFIVNTRTKAVMLSTHLSGNIAELRVQEKEAILLKSEQAFSRISDRIKEIRKEVDARSKEYESLKLSTEAKALETAFLSSYNKYNEILDQVLASSIDGRTEEAHALSVSKGLNLSNTAMSYVFQLTELQEKSLDKAKEDADHLYSGMFDLLLVLIFITVLLGVIVSLVISRTIARSVKSLVLVTESIARGNLETEVNIWGRDEMGQLGSAVDDMQEALRKAKIETEEQDWLKTGIARLNEVMRGEVAITALASKIISEISTYLGVQLGALYLTEDGEETTLSLCGSYAYTRRKNLSNVFLEGEGIVGQAALEKKQILISNVPDDYVKVASGLGEHVPHFICVTPFLHEDHLKGVVEVGSLGELTNLQLEYLNRAMPALAITIENIQNKEVQARLLEESQTLTKALQIQQEELKASNEELEEQTQLLLQSEQKLKNQQEELKTSNEELEEQTQLLLQSEQKLKSQQEELRVSNEELEEKNQSLQIQKKEIERTKKEIEIKAEELATASKYKSEFLANMSHELRTPLNSLLILSRMLADNKEGNLTNDQTESAMVIYNSGNDLLLLINEILDLSKIEAGRMDVNIREVLIKDLADNISANFKHVLEEKGLSLKINIDEKMPEVITSDDKRLEQILKNLMSNAIKFTKKGSVTVDFFTPSKADNLFRSGLISENSIAIRVTDTGIGIPVDKQRIIFEAFQQADGTTSREYGGTGLGLSISRELASLLGGEIQIESEPEKGSNFTIYLPVELDKSKSVEKTVAETNVAIEKKIVQLAPSKSSTDVQIKDDREHIQDNKNVILIIEDDPNFAKLLMDQCHEKKHEALVALDGEAGLNLAKEFLPLAIILDLHLPSMDGWAVLDGLKENPNTRHIPVHIMSVDESSIEAFRKGAIGYLTKPAKKEELDAAFTIIEDVSSKKIKNLLVIEDDQTLRNSMIKLIGNGDVYSKGVASGMDAIGELKSNKYDCIILDLGLPDMTGFELFKKLESERVVIPPVVVYTGRELSREEDLELKKYANSVIIKGVRSEERLLDETSLFLHRMVGKLPEMKKKMILNLYDSDDMFQDKKILIVDDDMRNVFALSQLLTQKGFKVLKAENGLKALDILDKEVDVDLVLMDIMMPELDGYEATKRIREQERFLNLPIIAFTAKAMKQDSEKCLAAGANDYMSKPVDINRMLSMMRVWLYR